MQRREAATNNNNITTTTTTTTNVNTSLASLTVNSLSSTVTTTVADLTTNKTSSSDLLSPDFSLNLRAARGPEVTSTPQKSTKTDSSQEMEVLETTETETSMDTSAEINHTSDMCESRESEASIRNSTAKTIMEIYDDKPLDFTKSTTKKPKDSDSPANDAETHIKSVAVIKENSKETASFSEQENPESKQNDDKASFKKEN